MGSTRMFRRYLVTGRVQGVGFRWFVEREARLIGVGGWVRNRDDGAVEVLASGSNAQLGLLYDKLKEDRGLRASIGSKSMRPLRFADTILFKWKIPNDHYNSPGRYGC